MADLTQQEWVSKLEADDNAVIIDVRTPGELRSGMIPKALHLDFYQGRDFIQELEKLDKNKHYYVYCRSGNRSGKACEIMNQLGIPEAYNLMGGMLDWEGEVVMP
ncbi:rhodanese-like domain-containing protein [Robertkochia sediminum]|uniref:rhodanese-like domain-containing protein n=1 Tax=Robertkochia sediminum TaxID=2785326 RepID=UPI001933F8DE|nr:rhodanese-like domain-containing protein [Robertkochia sediminum]MBL7471610.1 rhodanese-like domain-containing protein [Robertkochia sediminum]